MKIKGIIWLDDVIEKLISKHGVKQQEVREIFFNASLFRFVEKGHRPCENVYAAMGQTDAGLYLVVFFIYKRNKHALILSARKMSHSERDLL